MARAVIGFIILQYFLLICVHAQNGNIENGQTSDCRTPDDVNGYCISIRQCPALLAVLTTHPLPETSRQFLRLSQCGFERFDPKVCCPLVNNNNGDNGGRNTDGNGNNGQVTNGNDNNGQVTDGNNSNNGQVTVNLRNNPLLSDDCGRDLSQRIVGGEVTELDEFPWMVLLEYRKPTGTTTACGGVLISRRYVMTAAHCIKGKDLPRTWTLTSVRLGEYDTSTDRDCIDDGQNSRICAEDPVSIGIEEKITHEQYKPTSRNQQFDIALLRLARDVQFTNYIKPICLPTNSSFLQKLYVAGWGKTETRSESNVKLKLSLSVADVNACNKKYKSAGVELGNGQVCAGGQRGKDSCRGDSGGPLMSLERTSAGDSRWTAVGIVSFGPSPCGMQGWPGVYTKIYDYVPWAIAKMRP